MRELPTRAQILAFLAENPAASTRREIARAFGVKGSAKIDLKRLLAEMTRDGEFAGGAKVRHAVGRAEASALPPVAVLEVLGPDASGDLIARPQGREGPTIWLMPQPGDPALGAGDRVLARLSQAEQGDAVAPWQGVLIRHLGQPARRILGVFRKHAGGGGRILPIEKGETKDWLVPENACEGAQDGELVEAEPIGRRESFGQPRARVVARLGDPAAPRAVSLIAIRQHGIPDVFPDAALAEAGAALPPSVDGRSDLTHLPLITIDPADARDHDDACCAIADPDPANPGGHLVWVAIADVAHYVPPGSALDREALKRGNSTYFPDRVVPMLPETLSADLCSLHEGVERPCIAVEMVLSVEGRKLRHRFVRGIMRSRASLTYEAVQAAQDGRPDEHCADLLEPVIRPLFSAYAALAQARARRQPLDLDLPERRIVLSDEGKVTSVALKERLDAHRLIEEFMVLANVAAAEELADRRQPLLYRVHEAPTPEKLDGLRGVAQASGLVLAKGQVLMTRHLNALLAQAAGTDQAELINITTLRTMPQAFYLPQNLGHFGLALRAYAHFTSPIRRYADLVVHRALIVAHDWDRDGMTKAEAEALEETARLISETERRSMAAERDTVDRYLAAWLADRVGAEFGGRISGVQRFGLFVRLEESGADGLVPIRSVGREFFHFDAETQRLIGADTGLVLGIGQRVRVRLQEATPATGGLLLELLQVDDKGLPSGPAARRRGGAPRVTKGGRSGGAGNGKRLQRRRSR